MAIDRSGNSFAKAKRLGANRFDFRDALSSKDRVDFLSFALDQTSEIKLRLSIQGASNSQANADLALFNVDRQILKQSTRKGRRTETIQQTLDPGTYYLRVQRRSGDLRYRLSGSTSVQPPSIQFSQTVYQITEGETTPLILTRTGSTADISQVQVSVSGGSTTLDGFPLTITFNPGETRQELPISIYPDALREDLQTVELQLASLSRNAIASGRTRLQILDDDRPFNIEFDYRFDTTGWFTPERKAALEAAANFWENAIQDDFPNAPAGLSVPYIFNPQTDARINNFSIDRPVDDLLVFVGSRDLGSTQSGSSLAVAKQVGDYRGEGYFAFQEGYLGDDFEPWFGTITFNQSANLFVDSTPETRNDITLYDFIDTAIHELGHVLGIAGFTNAFFSQLDSSKTYFTGENARRVTSNVGIPIAADLGHIENGFSVPTSGKPSMARFGEIGKRFLPTVLDLAILDDIGYQIDYSAASLNPSPLPSFGRSNGQTNFSSTYARCACTSCLMTG